jgi:glycosyltransferase involved in cell wall biosynthesis
MKVAIVHDFLREYGGAERVVEALHEMWPDAPLYTSFVDWKALGNNAYRFKNWDIRPSWVQHNWFVKKFHSPLRFLAPLVWGSFNLSDYDVVISSSGWFMCRGVRAGDPSTRSARSGRALHVCYIHHPPRNLYGYATGSDLQKYWVVRVYAAIINFFLRHYDYQTAQRVDYFVANSKETARRVQKFYRRDSTVIYPPVEVNPKSKTLNSKQILNSKIKKEYFLSVGRLTYAKRVDLAIEACNKLKLPLKIVGTGKEEQYLRSIAGPTVEFTGGVTDDELSKLYAGAKALIFCALDEDFGIVPVEAMAQGVPVIALGQGGVLETIVDGNPSTPFGTAQGKGSGQATGVIFHEPTVESLINAIKQFGKLSIDLKQCIAQAEKFSKERFKRGLKEFVEKRYRALT